MPATMTKIAAEPMKWVRVHNLEWVSLAIFGITPYMQKVFGLKGRALGQFNHIVSHGKPIGELRVGIAVKLLPNGFGNKDIPTGILGILIEDVIQLNGIVSVVHDIAGLEEKDERNPFNTFGNDREPRENALDSEMVITEGLGLVNEEPPCVSCPISLLKSFKLSLKLLFLMSKESATRDDSETKMTDL